MMQEPEVSENTKMRGGGDLPSFTFAVTKNEHYFRDACRPSLLMQDGIQTFFSAKTRAAINTFSLCLPHPSQYPYHWHPWPLCGAPRALWRPSVPTSTPPPQGTALCSIFSRLTLLNPRDAQGDRKSKNNNNQKSNK